jgi:hypothetical protein
MDLLTNAVSSIDGGFEDYQTGTPERLLSAVRNIHADVLLLYKGSLCRKSPRASASRYGLARRRSKGTGAGSGMEHGLVADHPAGGKDAVR